MASNEERDDLERTSRAIAQLDVVRRSKISPGLRAAVVNWEQKRLAARRDGAEPDVLSRAPVAPVLIELTGPDTSELEATGVEFKHLFGVFFAATVSLDRLVELSGLESVKHIHRERETSPTLDDSIPEIRANTVRNPAYPFAGTNKFNGAGIIIGIIDSGINYLHPVFRLPNDQSKSRILAILDQTVTPNVTITKGEIETAIASNTQLILPGKMISGTRVETDNDDHKHGTHVAGIAAGNGNQADCHDKYTYVGVAPEADLVIVKHSFVSVNGDLQAAIEFIATFARTVGANGVPCVINMSLGHTIGPHDGTDPVDQMIETFLTGWAAGGGKPVVLVAAAGNSGGHAQGTALGKGDDSHVTGLIPRNPPGQPKQITFRLPDLSQYNIKVPKGTSHTSLQFRYTAPVGLGCRLIPPGNKVSGPNSAAPDMENMGFTELDRGSTCSIHSAVENVAAGIRRLEINIDSVAGKFNKFGDWVVELTSGNAGPITYHGWITGPQFERFADPDLSQASTIDSPGSAPSIICVGSYASSGKDKGKIADSSSRGPLLGAGPPSRQKPDISAPGVDICSAKRDFNDTCCCDCCCSSYIDMSGTSMAAPHVTGAVALMLQRNPTLSHSQIKSALMATAVRDAFTTPALPDNTFGQGKLDVRACLNEPTVRGAGPAIASAGSSRRARVTPMDSIEAAARRTPAIPQLQEGTPLWRLMRTAEGQELYLRGRTHWEEVRALVNANKRIATAWHRNSGPLLMHHVTRATMLPHVVLPLEMDGELISIRAARLVSALEPHASKELIRALHQTLPLIAQLEGKTLLEVVEMFEAREADKDATVLEHA